MRLLQQGVAPLVLVVAAVAFLAVPGCSKKQAPKNRPADSGAKADAAKKKGHTHPHEGPHGGVLAEWGEENHHAEFTVDRKTKQATVYILDGSGKKSSPIAAETITLTISNVKPPLQIALKADPQKDDPKGSSSRFVGTHEKLGTDTEFRGEISGQVGGTPYTGTFEETDRDRKKDSKT